MRRRIVQRLLDVYGQRLALGERLSDRERFSYTRLEH